MKIRFTAGARDDLNDIRDWLRAYAGPAFAVRVIGCIRDRTLMLRDVPTSGNIPPELDPLGINAYRELHEPPYRIVYSVERDAIVIRLIADARRDFRALLERRLLR